MAFDWGQALRHFFRPIQLPRPSAAKRTLDTVTVRLTERNKIELPQFFHDDSVRYSNTHTPTGLYALAVGHSH